MERITGIQKDVFRKPQASYIYHFVVYAAGEHPLRFLADYQ